MSRRARVTLRAHAPPTVPELVIAPELAAISLLENALHVANDALLAQHPSLLDDLRDHRRDGRVVALAHTICLRAADLRDALERYTTAVQEAVASRHVHDDDLPF